jgi:hypothetical protein
VLKELEAGLLLVSLSSGVDHLPRYIEQVLDRIKLDLPAAFGPAIIVNSGVCIRDRFAG